MSYINEALKKAQKDRDTRYMKYSGVLSAKGKDRRAFSGKTAWWSLLLIMLILLVFTSYSWLDFKGGRRTRQAESAHTVPPPATLHETAIDVETLYDRARLLHKNSQIQEAKKVYQQALRLDPGHVDVLNNLGVLYIYDKEYQAAQRSFEKAIRLKPGHVDPYYNLACLHAIRGETRQGIEYLKKAVSLDHSVRDWAQRDTDLENLRVLPEFKEIIGSE
ncbi:MAG: tetratricopeptide repeat protein [Deltaproteobacteria bacterium]|nr:tetratricopeptide repeat protein [Deltaproteobacteria bacterium]